MFWWSCFLYHQDLDALMWHSLRIVFFSKLKQKHDRKNPGFTYHHNFLLWTPSLKDSKTLFKADSVITSMKVPLFSYLDHMRIGHVDVTVNNFR